MPHMSPIYWLVLLMYFIFMLTMMAVFIYYFFVPLHSMKLILSQNNNSMIWMW